MRPLTEIEKRAQLAVQKVRAESLSSGKTFMIYDKDLPDGKYYMEYPDGSVKIVTPSQKLKDFIVEKVLTRRQADLVRDGLNAQFI
ncbi:hypothetical protein ACTJJ0_22690 [Chitinophaga sp. 22321]|uniref:Uncharacterized protein n=1 Tax=Chitinophaga hostae TaxID=2831022 RepID=A0ABS5J8G1_9BACT|nr:hypothetical protein [Chitinophaga hostae]MBS0031503.1 hypothetical protein [Chitinophaga hostae]